MGDERDQRVGVALLECANRVVSDVVAEHLCTQRTQGDLDPLAGFLVQLGVQHNHAAGPVEHLGAAAGPLALGAAHPVIGTTLVLAGGD